MASGAAATEALGFATYPTPLSLAAAVKALGGGWSAEVLGDYALFPSADLAARLELYVEEVNGWRLSDQAGVLVGFFAGGQRNIRVDYAAGWAGVPQDVQAACVQHCVDLYLSEQRDGSLRREGIGGFSQYEILADVVEGEAGDRRAKHTGRCGPLAFNSQPRRRWTPDLHVWGNRATRVS